MKSLQIWRAATNISNWKYGIPIVFKLHRLETISQTHNIHFAHHNCKYRLPQLSHHQAAQSIIKRSYLHESYGQVLSLTKDAGHKQSQAKEVFLKHAAHHCDWCAWYKNWNQLPHIHTHTFAVPAVTTYTTINLYITGYRPHTHNTQHSTSISRRTTTVQYLNTGRLHSDWSATSCLPIQCASEHPLLSSASNITIEPIMCIPTHTYVCVCVYDNNGIPPVYIYVWNILHNHLCY